MITYLLLYLFLALGVSFVCSLLESTLMSTTLSYITLREEEGYKPASLMKKYKTETERPLAAILSLNTIANTVGASGVGMQATLIFGEAWFGVCSAIMTVLILVFSEIFPKTIGTTYWKHLMGLAAHTIRILIFVMYPIVKLIEFISRLFPEPDEAAVSREEVIAMAGGIPATTGKIIAGGPMMGRAMDHVEGMPANKRISGLLFLPEAESIKPEAENCIRCGKCVDACPMGLEPYLLSRLTALEMWDEVEDHAIMDCIDCGCCVFSCPSHRRLLDDLRAGKAKVGGIIRARAAEKK